MDELGRGTSTFDGYAIAHSVLNYILSRTQCRLLFTTHYHWLVDDFKLTPGVALYHMKIEQEEKSNEESASGDETALKRRIKYLYKFEEGVANFSFGVCVGSMAGLP